LNQLLGSHTVDYKQFVPARIKFKFTSLDIMAIPLGGTFPDEHVKNALLPAIKGLPRFQVSLLPLKRF